MGYTYTILSTYNLYYIKASGKVNGDEIIKTKTKIFLDPKWKQGMNHISDYTDIKVLTLNREDIDLIAKIEAEHEKKFRDKRKLAIVCNNELYKAVLKYYEMNAKKLFSKTKVCKTLNEAINWLGLDITPDILFK